MNVRTITPRPPLLRREIQTEDYGGDFSLLCPRCGDGFIHHGQVAVFSRPKEEGPVSLTRVASDGLVVVGEKAIACNPSSRRDGIAIGFWCESCGEDDFELTIEQHKGNTFIQWREISRR